MLGSHNWSCAHLFLQLNVPSCRRFRAIFWVFWGGKQTCLWNTGTKALPEWYKHLLYILYCTLAKARTPQRIKQSGNGIIWINVKSCLGDIDTACHDYKLPLRRKWRKSIIHHFCCVKVLSKWRVHGDKNCLGGEFESHMQLLNAEFRPEPLTLSDWCNKIIWFPIYFKKVVEQNSRWL